MAALPGRRRHDQNSHLSKRPPTNDLPYKFEAGTPTSPAASASAPRSITSRASAWDQIAAYEHGLLVYGTEALSRIPGLRIIGTARDKAPCSRLSSDGIHPHDIGTVLDRQGIAVRTGHIARQPVDGPFRRARHHSRFARLLQHDCGDRRPGGRSRKSKGDFLLMVDDLYQEIIIDHSKRPRNCHPMADANRKAEGYNPLCGDELKLYIKIENDIVKDVSWVGHRLRHLHRLRVFDDPKA